MGTKNRSLGFKKKYNPEQPYSKGIHALAFGSAASNSAWEVAEISSNQSLNAIKAGCLVRSFVRDRWDEPQNWFSSNA